MRAHAGGKQRVAVRRGRRDPRRTDTAAGPTDILDDERLAKNSAHLLADDAGDDIACAAGRKRHDHGDRARGVRLR